MKTKDYLIVALAPLPILLIPLIGGIVSPSNWKWTASDHVAAWIVLAITTLVFRFLVTRPVANFAYKAGVALAVATGFLITWISMAVQIIGDENPANLLYFLVILGGLIGVALSRFQPANLARVAFALAASVLVIPIVAFLGWPGDFSPGVPQVFLLNGCFALMFIGAGLLLHQAANTARATRAA